MKKVHIRMVLEVVTFFFLFSVFGGHFNDIFSNKVIKVHAEQNVRYTYDSLGRVVYVTYPDGTVVHYEYDKNGNMLSGTIQKNSGGTTESPGSGGTTGSSGGTTQSPGSGGTTGSSGGTTQSPGSGGTTGSSGGTTQSPESGGIPGSSGGTTQTPESGGTTQNSETESDKQQPVVNVPHDTAADIKIYNAFKKKKLVIKSLKLITEKNKRYLKIQIRKLGKKNDELETEYEIKYATNSKFKKGKTVTVSKKRKKSVTGKKWKVKKGKTYYVKVRACMRTKAGKKIYSKYSATKKLEVK